jgi:hypothetical protein
MSRFGKPVVNLTLLRPLGPKGRGPFLLQISKFMPTTNSIIPESLARRMQWERVAAGLKAIKALPNSE